MIWRLACLIALLCTSSIFAAQGSPSPGKIIEDGVNSDPITISLQRIEKGESHQACEDLQKLAQVYALQEDKTRQAQALSALGQALHIVGDLREALRSLEKAIALQTNIGDLLDLAISRGRIGSVYFDLGDLEHARESFDQELSLAKPLGNQALMANALRKLAMVELKRGRFDQALLRLDEALVLNRAAKDLQEEGKTLTILGSIHTALGQYEPAVESLHHALEIWERLDSSPGKAETFQRLGELDRAQGRLEEANLSFSRALAICRMIQSQFGTADALEGIASIHIARGEYEQASREMSEVLALWRAIRYRSGEAAALTSLGSIWASLGRWDSAIEALHRALSIHREIGDSTGIIQTLEVLGGAYESTGSLQEALHCYEEAIELHEKRRSETVLREVRSGLEYRSAMLFQRTVRLLLRLGKGSQAFEMTEKSRARTLLERWGAQGLPADEKIDDQVLLIRRQLDTLDRQLREERSSPSQTRNTTKINDLNSQILSKQAEFESLVTRKSSVIPERFQPRSLSEIQRHLLPDTTLLSYYTAVDYLVAFVVGRDSFHAIKIPLENEKIVQAVEVFRDFSSLEKPDLSGLKLLHDALILPLRPYLETPRIGIIPQGALSYLPFAALTDGEMFLGDSHSFFYLPSASLYDLVTSREPPKTSSLLAFAASRVNGLPSLPYAEEEVRSVASLFESRYLFIGSQATEGALRRDAGKSSILHIAAHAELNTVNPAFSRLLLQSDKDYDGALEVREISQLRLDQTDLVVLSASMTSITTLGNGDEINGFSYAFLAVGVPSVVASLWRVDDRSTALFMQAFYRNLQKGQAKAEALRAAQIELRRQPRFSHPYYWAAFVLSGDPGKEPPSPGP